MRPTYDYGHPIVAWNGRGLGILGDDSSTLLDLGFNSAQIQQIMSAYQSGALSAGGYQALVSGFVSPDDLADFMAADPGATQTSTPRPTTSASVVPISSVNATLTPSPSPIVAAPAVNPFAWFTQATFIAGVPNFFLLGLAAVLLLGGGYAGGRRR